MGKHSRLPSQDGLLSLIDGFYDAALRPSQWPAAMDRVAECLASPLRGIWIRDRSTDQPLGTLADNAITPDGMHAYLEYFGSIDPMPVGARKLGMDRAFALADLVDVGSFRQGEFFRDFWVPHAEEELLGGQAELDEGRILAIHWQRPTVIGAFDALEVSFLGRLLPHIRRAVQIHERLQGLDARSESIRELLDRLACGVLLVNAGGRIVIANQAAETVLRAIDGLRLDLGELRATSPRDDARLRALLGDILGDRHHPHAGSGGSIPVARPSGKRPYQLTIAPLRGPHAASLAPGRPTAIIFLRDPEEAQPLAEELLRVRWGLTPSEARLARQLAAGLPLAQVAEEAGVTIGTARNQLKNVFGKTGTRRQGELISLLLRVAPPVTAR